MYSNAYINRAERFAIGRRNSVTIHPVVGRSNQTPLADLDSTSKVLQPTPASADLTVMESVPSKSAVNRPHPLAQNRRRGNRHRLNIPATLTLEGQKTAEIQVTVTEMSVGGIGLRAPEALEMQANYRISSFDTLIPHGLHVSVVTQRRRPDGQFEIGAKTI